MYRRILFRRWWDGRGIRAFVLLKPKNICGNANFIFHTRPAGYMVPSYLKICIMVPWHVYVHTSSSPPLAVGPLLARACRKRTEAFSMRFFYERTKYNASRVATVPSPPHSQGLKNPSIVVGDRKYPICPPGTTPRGQIFFLHRSVIALLPWPRCLLDARSWPGSTLSPEGEKGWLKSPNGCAFKRLIARQWGSIRQTILLDIVSLDRGYYRGFSLSRIISSLDTATMWMIIRIIDRDTIQFLIQGNCYPF